MNNQEDKPEGESLEEKLSKPIGNRKIPFTEDPFSEAAIRFRAGEDAVFRSILDAPHLRNIETAKANWPNLKFKGMLDLPTHFVNPFNEQGKAMIESGEAVFDISSGNYVKKSYLDELYGKPKRTPVENRKVRNACMSGHTPEQYASCPWCRQARFYQITSGYYADIPELEEVETILRQTEQTDERKFVLEYLELPENATKEQIDAFLIKMVWIEKLTTWAKRTFSSQYVLHPFSRNYVPLAPPYQGKSGFVASLIMQHKVIRDIYASSIMAGYEEFITPLGAERFLKQFDRPGSGDKIKVAQEAMERAGQKAVTIYPRRPGRSTLNAAIAETLTKKFVGVDPGTDPASVIVVDSLGGFQNATIGDTHGSVTKKPTMREPIKKPASKLMQALLQSFNKRNK